MLYFCHIQLTMVYSFLFRFLVKIEISVSTNTMKIRWFVKKLTTWFFSAKFYIENDSTLIMQHLAIRILRAYCCIEKWNMKQDSYQLTNY